LRNQHIDLSGFTYFNAAADGVAAEPGHFGSKHAKEISRYPGKFHHKKYRRFWARYLELLENRQVKEPVCRWHVRRAEEFL